MCSPHTAYRETVHIGMSVDVHYRFKPLAGDDRAMAVLNRNDQLKIVSFDWANEKRVAKVPGHDVLMLRLRKQGAVYPEKANH